jgi:SAM-dependent methyltransferase
MADEDRYTAYDEFAWLFDRYWSGRFAEDVRPVLQECLLPHVPAGGKILDLCCGSGRLSHWLTVCGFEVTGVDGSEEMVRLARVNAPRAEFLVADAREFIRRDGFDAVISTFDSLNHLPARGDLARVFENVRRSLRPEGLFFFDMNMEEGFLASAPDSAAVVRQDHVYITESSYDPSTRVGRNEVTIFSRRNGAWRRSDVEIVEYCYGEDEIQAALAEAGFADVERFDGERDLEMHDSTGRLFFLASAAELPRAREEEGAEPRGKP